MSGLECTIYISASFIVLFFLITVTEKIVNYLKKTEERNIAIDLASIKDDKAVFMANKYYFKFGYKGTDEFIKYCKDNIDGFDFYSKNIKYILKNQQVDDKIFNCFQNEFNNLFNVNQNYYNNVFEYFADVYLIECVKLEKSNIEDDLTEIRDNSSKTIIEEFTNNIGYDSLRNFEKFILEFFQNYEFKSKFTKQVLMGQNLKISVLQHFNKYVENIFGKDYDEVYNYIEDKYIINAIDSFGCFVENYANENMYDIDVLFRDLYNKYKMFSPSNTLFIKYKLIEPYFDIEKNYDKIDVNILDISDFPQGSKLYDIKGQIICKLNNGDYFVVTEDYCRDYFGYDKMPPEIENYRYKDYSNMVSIDVTKGLLDMFKLPPIDYMSMEFTGDAERDGNLRVQQLVQKLNSYCECEQHLAKEKIRLKYGEKSYNPDNVESIDLNYVSVCIIEDKIKNLILCNSIEKIPGKEGEWYLFKGERSVLDGDCFEVD